MCQSNAHLSQRKLVETTDILARPVDTASSRSEDVPRDLVYPAASLLLGVYRPSGLASIIDGREERSKFDRDGEVKRSRREPDIFLAVFLLLRYVVVSREMSRSTQTPKADQYCSVDGGGLFGWECFS
jgi:hypothetical protein